MLQFKLSIQHKALWSEYICNCQFWNAISLFDLLPLCQKLNWSASESWPTFTRGLGKNESKIVDWTTSNRINAIYFEQSNSIDCTVNTLIVFEGKKRFPALFLLKYTHEYDWNPFGEFFVCISLSFNANKLA